MIFAVCGELGAVVWEFIGLEALGCQRHSFIVELEIPKAFLLVN